MYIWSVLPYSVDFYFYHCVLILLGACVHLLIHVIFNVPNVYHHANTGASDLYINGLAFNNSNEMLGEVAIISPLSKQKYGGLRVKPVLPGSFAMGIIISL